MSAPSWLRLEAMPPWAFPALIQWSVPLVSTSICLTDGEVVDSMVAIAAVPTEDAVDRHRRESRSACAQLPDRYSAARSGVPTPPPTQTVMLDR